MTHKPRARVYRHPGRLLGARESDLNLGGKTCIRDTGLSTEVIYSRWLAGEDDFMLSQDTGAAYGDIIAAIHFELGRQWRSENSIEALEP